MRFFGSPCARRNLPLNSRRESGTFPLYRRPPVRETKAMRSFRLVLAAAILSSILGALAVQANERPRLYTNEHYVEDVTRQASLPLDQPLAMLDFVLESLPAEVKVFPTENYYYFYFYEGGARYAGNIRLDVKDRDLGKVHFAYYADPVEWIGADDKLQYRILGREDGVRVERVTPLRYRVSHGKASVEFVLNDLSRVAPPARALAPADKFLGPIFDEAAIRLFLIYNTRLKIFHFVLDETVRIADDLVPSRFTDRILIGRRTGFAFYRDHQFDRKILIGVFSTNTLLNNYFDGPFDQLPDNFIRGDELRQAILDSDPKFDGEMDRYGATPDGSARYVIAPYMYYRTEDELYYFHECATNPAVARERYHACFVMPDFSQDGTAEDEPKR
jgi:hypothetical protein